MDRRRFLAAAGAFSTLPPHALAAGEGLRSAAREAWLYGLPLMETAATRQRALSGGQHVNAFAHARALAGPANRAVTTPNNDTLYSSAWLDLAGGPMTVTVPPTGARYVSLALMDMFTNNFAVLGARTIGPDGGVFTLVGPTRDAKLGAIRSPTPWVWALARTLVDGPEDLAAAHAVQDGLRIAAQGGRTPQPVPGRAAPWPEYFAAIQRLLQENPPPAVDTALLRRIAPLGLTTQSAFDPARFSGDQAAQIQAGIADARPLLLGMRGRQKVENGWTYPPVNLGDFGQDYVLRAATAIAGLAALPPAEAIYIRPTAPNGGFVFQDGRFRLGLPGPLPADGFWSLTMYEATPDGQFFLTGNAINRYAIGDRTPHLRRDLNGSMDIWIGREDPGGSRTANWLPAPAKGPFAMTMRAYLPRQEFLDGRYRLPPLEAF